MIHFLQKGIPDFISVNVINQMKIRDVGIKYIKLSICRSLLYYTLRFFYKIVILLHIPSFLYQLDDSVYLIMQIIFTNHIG